MLKIYSKSCEYVLRALSKVPREACDKPLLAKELCKKAKVPESSTRKGFQKLANCGLLHAVSGPGGGYRLAGRPKDISLYSIVLGIDGDGVFDQCIMGLPQCKDSRPCPIHESWKKLRTAMALELKKKKLADLINAVNAF